MQTISKQLIRSDELRKHIAQLASLQANDSMFVSCYLDLNPEAGSHRQQLESLIEQHGRSLQAKDRLSFEDAARAITFQLNSDIDPAARGLALFARSDAESFVFVGLQLAVPVTSQMTVHKSADIFPLMEILDDYDRFKLLRVKRNQLEVYEIDLGVVNTCATMKLDPALSLPTEERDSVSSIQFARTCQKIEKLLRLNRRDYFIIAGQPQIAYDIVQNLSTSTQGRFVDVIDMADTHGNQSMFASAINTFSQFEEEQSRDIANRIAHTVYANGLAVAGPVASLSALQNGIVDTLVIVKNYQPSTGWVCHDCGQKQLHSEKPDCCLECGSHHVTEFNLRNTMVRLAGQQGVAVEVVESEDELGFLGGVGCLLGASEGNSKPLSLDAAA